MNVVDAAQAALTELEGRGLRRTIRVRDSRQIDFASNDYLGLAHDPDVRAALGGATRVGSGGARLLSGAHAEHAALERELAAFVGRERALLFSSGYLAAVGAVQGLAPLVRRAYSDAANHASIIDGLRLASLERTIVHDGVLPVSDGTPTLVVTESVFGMSGECADLAALLAQLGPSDILLVDEAHALGVVGERGAGLAATLDDPRVVVIGTLSKAFGCAGGFIAGAASVIELLISTARTFIFDTSMPPALASAANAALTRIIAGEQLRAQLRGNVAELCDGLRARGIDAPARETPIVPIALGSAERAVQIGEALLTAGIFAPPVRPPTVPEGTARIRLSVRADHSATDIAHLLAALESLV